MLTFFWKCLAFVGGVLVAMMREFLGWLAFGAVVLVAIIIVVFVKDHFESDAERKADDAKATASMNKFIGRIIDKSGILEDIAAVDSMSDALFNDCKSTLVSANANVSLSDEDKNTFCGCAKRGVTKYFYTLRKSDLLERVKLSNPREQSPLDIRKDIYATCNASRDAYPPP